MQKRKLFCLRLLKAKSLRKWKQQWSVVHEDRGGYYIIQMNEFFFIRKLKESALLSNKSFAPSLSNFRPYTAMTMGIARRKGEIVGGCNGDSKHAL